MKRTGCTNISLQDSERIQTHSSRTPREYIKQPDRMGKLIQGTKVKINKDIQVLEKSNLNTRIRIEQVKQEALWKVPLIAQTGRQTVRA